MPRIYRRIHHLPDVPFKSDQKDKGLAVKITKVIVATIIICIIASGSMNEYNSALLRLIKKVTLTSQAKDKASKIKTWFL
jgi:hypothetical protein